MQMTSRIVKITYERGASAYRADLRYPLPVVFAAHWCTSFEPNVHPCTRFVHPCVLPIIDLWSISSAKRQLNCDADAAAVHVGDGAYPMPESRKTDDIFGDSDPSLNAHVANVANSWCANRYKLNLMVCFGVCVFACWCVFRVQSVTSRHYSD